MSAFDELGERVIRSIAGRYTVGDRIGAGGSSVVYSAADRETGRPVALKVLRPEFAASTTATRFEREIRLSQSLVHPNIVPVLDSGVADDLMYLVMPLLEHSSLRDRLKVENQLPISEAVRITREVASALAHSHAHGVIHRDVKPGNVLLVGGMAMVTDFGIAHVASNDDKEKLTASGVSIGTPEYMSPEQASGHRNVDVRTDVYSLGCVLYEMLVGEPPFVGRSSQTVIARQLHDPPSPPTHVRRTVPAGVEAVVLKALAKAPVDRFQTMEALIEALDAPELMAARAQTRRVQRRLAGAAFALLTLAAVAVLLRDRPTLDPGRVMIFPLREVGLSSLEGTGEAVSTFIGYALESVESLKWLNGADLLSEIERRPGAVVPTARFRALARRAGAAYFIEGSVSRDGDSATALLALHSAGRDSAPRLGRGAMPLLGASFPKVGLQAVGKVLPALLSSGRRPDLSVLEDRDAVAIGHFLAGERAYRSMQFSEAMMHFREAVSRDSAFAIAALRGALAASWKEQLDTARSFVEVAVRRSAALPQKYALLARGSWHYLSGRALPAIAAFDSAIARDSAMADAWMGLAESYNHLAPSLPATDSLAEWAFNKVVDRDSAFSLALFHLAQIELRRNQHASAIRFTQVTDSLGGDSALRKQVRLMRECAADPSRVAWQQLVAADPQMVLAIAKSLMTPARPSPCADSAFHAVLVHSPSSGSQRWGALLGSTAILVRAENPEGAVRLLGSPSAAGLPAWSLLLLASAAEGRPLTGADSVVASLGTDYRSMLSSRLWLLTSWHSMRGSTTALRELRQALAARVDSTHARVDSQFLRIVSARLTLAEGDTVAAMTMFRSLEPNGGRADMTWQPWEALAGERLQLAELLLAKGEPSNAARVASYLDATEPLVHVMFRRKALDVRIRAARALGDRREVAHLLSQDRALTKRDAGS